LINYEEKKKEKKKRKGETIKGTLSQAKVGSYVSKTIKEKFISTFMEETFHTDVVVE